MNSSFSFDCCIPLDWCSFRFSNKTNRFFFFSEGLWFSGKWENSYQWMENQKWWTGNRIRSLKWRGEAGYGVRNLQKKIVEKPRVLAQLLPLLFLKDVLMNRYFISVVVNWNLWVVARVDCLLFVYLALVESCLAWFSFLGEKILFVCFLR